MKIRFPAAWSALLVLADLLFLATLLVVPCAWLLDPLLLRLGPLHLTVHWNWKPILAPVLLLAARGILRRVGARRAPGARGLWEAAGFRKFSLALVSTWLLFGALESVLKWTRFDADLPPVIFQGQDAAGGIQVPHTTPDPELLYRLTPGTFFQGRLVNSLGFREREVKLEKDPGTIRVVCMGDSVTGQGRPGYSQYLHESLKANPPGGRSWEAFNIGVHGYSALQGLRQFQKIGRALAPDIVTVYFGWNDHWLSKEADRQIMGLVMRPWAGRVFEVLRHKRFFRFFIWSLGPVQHLARRQEGADRVLRVPPEEYRSALKALVREIRAAGAVPILLTAPRRSLAAGVVDKLYVRSIADGNRLHDEYADITRAVAGEMNCELLDLARLMAGPECDGFFSADGIHFDAYSHEGYLPADPPAQPGLQRIALELDRKIRAVATAPEWARRRPAAN